MPFRLPIRRYLQTTEKTETPATRFGNAQWVVARPLLRFQTFDLAQVPPKNRPQALQLELAQWTPFANSGYYVGWQGARAWVWGWDADKVQAAIAAQGLKPKRVQISPESLLLAPLENGLCLTRCREGFEGQLWQGRLLERSRWWLQMPSAEEWLSFQRDAAIAPSAQQGQLPAVRDAARLATPWLRQSETATSRGALIERPLMALGLLCLLAPALWFSLNLYKTEESTHKLRLQQAQLQDQAAPILLARGQALDYMARIQALQALARAPDQLALMGRVAEVLPKNGSFLKDWEFSGRQLKFTLTAAADVPTTPIIDVLQKARTFTNVTALPGRDPKSVMFQMDVIAH